MFNMFKNFLLNLKYIFRGLKVKILLNIPP
nr:MAG TPA: hypothetical protein [Herelleviridae sp.]